MQPVHSYTSSPTEPETLNLTIVVHLGQRPSTVFRVRWGLILVLFLLPILKIKFSVLFYKLPYRLTSLVYYHRQILYGWFLNGRMTVSCMVIKPFTIEMR